MPRRLFIVLITSLASFGANRLSAADRPLPKPKPQTRTSEYRSEQPPEIPSARVLIFERARRRAEVRAARLEALEYAGISPSRPVVSFSPFTIDPHMNPGLYNPWIAYYKTRGAW